MSRYFVEIKEKALLDLAKLKKDEPKFYVKALKLIGELYEHPRTGTGKPKHQLMAECAWAAIYTMRDPKGKTAADLFPALFTDDDEDRNNTAPISEQEAAELLAEIEAFNKIKNPG